MAALHETIFGRNFFQNQLPALVKSLKRIADCLEKQQQPEIKMMEIMEVKDVPVRLSELKSTVPKNVEMDKISVEVLSIEEVDGQPNLAKIAVKINLSLVWGTNEHGNEQLFRAVATKELVGYTE